MATNEDHWRHLLPAARLENVEEKLHNDQTENKIFFTVVSVHLRYYLLNVVHFVKSEIFLPNVLILSFDFFQFIYCIILFPVIFFIKNFIKNYYLLLLSLIY